MSTYKKIINAVYDDEVVRVYQAYNAKIAEDAVKHQRFTTESGWTYDRTTWIKPSFCWMLYRSGYASKHNQERILAIDINRESFEWILENHIENETNERLKQSNSHIESEKRRIVVQWDPERNLKIGKIDGSGDIRSIQIGIKRSKTKEYNEVWIQSITDVTHIAHQIKQELDKNNIEKAQSLLPDEKLYKPKNIKF